MSNLPLSSLSRTLTKDVFPTPLLPKTTICLPKEESALVKNKLVQKCRDSFLYEYAMDNISKPAFFLVLIGLDSLSTADLNIQTDILKKHIPVDGPPGTSWPERFIKGCMIMNLQTWNKHLTQFPVSRISSEE